MRVGIMQPTYLPWCGYFEMIANTDVFVLLDNVQFVRSSWQHRNRIKGPNGEIMLTAPVKSSKEQAHQILEYEINYEQDFPRKHLEVIKQHYRKSQNFISIFPRIEYIYKMKEKKLAILNEELIKFFCKELGIKTKIIRASELKALGKKTELLVNICNELEASSFYAAIGSKSYVDLEYGFAHHHIKVEYQNYVHPIYPQLFGDFIPQLSVIDLLFNCGDKSLEIINSGKIIV